MKVRLDHGAIAPKRAHDTDAGVDLFSPVSCRIAPGGSAVIDTGVHIEIPVGWCGLLVAKSGLNVNSSVTSTGLIDAGYTGSIRVKLYNHGEGAYDVHAGDKISQLVILPCMIDRVEIVDQIGGGERGDDGFGSTGR